MKKSTSTHGFQIIWGVLLTLAGIGVFYRIPQVIPKLEASGNFTIPVIQVCFYFIGIILIGGGIIKVYNNAKQLKNDTNDQ